MHDINFFAYKKEQKKNNSFMMFLIILLVIIILVNGVLFGGGYYLLKGIEDDIKDKQSYIDDTAIQLAIKEAEQIKKIGRASCRERV